MHAVHSQGMQCNVSALWRIAMLQQWGHQELIACAVPYTCRQHAGGREGAARALLRRFHPPSAAVSGAQLNSLCSDDSGCCCSHNQCCSNTGRSHSLRSCAAILCTGYCAGARQERLPSIDLSQPASQPHHQRFCHSNAQLSNHKGCCGAAAWCSHTAQSDSSS
jgi:hypothetical protein